MVGDADAMLNSLSSTGRNNLMAFIKETLDDLSEHVYSRQGTTTNWTFVIPETRLVRAGLTESAVAGLTHLTPFSYISENGIQKTETFWNFLRDRLSELSPMRVYDYYNFDERFLNGSVPVFRRWYFDTIRAFEPEATRLIFSGPDPNSMERALGLPPKVLNFRGNYSVSFNSIESMMNIPANLNSIASSVLTMNYIEDFGAPIPISVPKVSNRVTFLNDLRDQLNNVSTKKIFHYQIINERIRWTYLDRTIENHEGLPEVGSGAVAFEFALGSDMAKVLGFPVAVNQQVYSFDRLYATSPVDVTTLRKQEPVQEPVGMYLKAFTERGSQIMIQAVEGFDPLQTLLDPNGQNGCLCQDNENIYVAYLVARKTLTGFVTFHVERYYKDSLRLVWGQKFVLPDADIDKFFPRLLPFKNEVHLVYARNDDRI
jgi:hypothetical protein